MSIVGIPKEIKSLENRVGLTPDGVRALTSAGIKVLVETRAGEASGFPDKLYRECGAEIAPSAAAVYQKAAVIQKVKEPLAAEFSFLRSEHVIFCFLHLASQENCALVEALMASGSTAIGFETLEKNGRLPLLAPMSEIAGSLAAAYGAYFAGLNLWGGSLERDYLPDLEKIARSYPGFAPSGLKATVIYGGGVAGQKAMEAAQQISAGEVVVIEKNEERREFLKKSTPLVFDPEDSGLEAYLEKAQVMIGCVHARGSRAARVLSDEKLKRISGARKKVILDVSIDQGGNFPESRSTIYQKPVYFDSAGNVRFGVANMPSLCGRGASEALSAASLLYLSALGKDPLKAFQEFPELEAAVNIRSGKILIPAIKEVHKR